MNGHKVVAATITISFLSMLPIETETIVQAMIDRVDGRKIHLKAKLIEPSGRVVAEGSGLFVVLREDQLKALEPS
jgi:acyl-CoA thioesterase FadM